MQLWEKFCSSWESSSPSIAVNTPGTYTLKASNMCGETESSVEVGHIPVENVFVPNIITPGGDEYNQCFELPETSGDVSLTIYNRWGQKLFHSSDYQNDWDGGDLPSGIYYYQVSGDCIGNLKGSLTLLRQ